MESRRIRPGGAVCAAVAHLLLVSLPTSAHAAIVVDSAEVVDGTYTYNIGYTNANQALADAVTNTNFAFVHFSDNTRLTYALDGNTYAELVLHWDFSASGLSPRSVALTDRTTLFTDTLLRANFAESTRATVHYSVNGSNWFLIDTQETPLVSSGMVVNDDWTNVILDLGGGTEHFYYRVTMITLPDDVNGVFTATRNQWSRVNPGVTTTFRTVFSAEPVPEPTTLSLLLLGGLALIRRRRKV